MTRCLVSFCEVLIFGLVSVIAISLHCLFHHTLVACKFTMTNGVWFGGTKLQGRNYSALQNWEKNISLNYRKCWYWMVDLRGGSFGYHDFFFTMIINSIRDQGIKFFIKSWSNTLARLNEGHVDLRRADLFQSYYSMLDLSSRSQVDL